MGVRLASPQPSRALRARASSSSARPPSALRCSSAACATPAWTISPRSSRRIGKEEREQYELLAVGTAGRELPRAAPWEYAWHFMGPQADKVPVPRNTREVLKLALSAERRTHEFLCRRGRARRRRRGERLRRRDGDRRAAPHRAPGAPARARAESQPRRSRTSSSSTSCRVALSRACAGWRRGWQSSSPARMTFSVCSTISVAVALS